MDNVYYDQNCPARMQDGRQFTDYNTNDVLDKFYDTNLLSVTEHDYRKKLQAGGEGLIRQNLNFYLAKTCDCGGWSCTRKSS